MSSQQTKIENQMQQHQITNNIQNQDKIIKQNQVQTNKVKQKQQQVAQQIPEHFYDSDIASVCQKDFMSDSQPPKDIVQERKLLYKQKFLHVFKTIIRIGQCIDKPARFDLIKIKFKEVSQDQIVIKKKKNKQQNINTQNQQNSQKTKQNIQQNKQIQKQEKQQLKQKQTDETKKEQTQITNILEQYPPYYSSQYVNNCQIQQYNIGTRYQQIQRLVTSMKRGQTALFQLQILQTSKKSNIKIKRKTEIYVIQVFDWTTVIDLEGDRKLLKQVLVKGQGAFRINYYDQANFQYSIKIDNYLVQKQKYQSIKFQKQFVQKQLGKTLWRVLTSMKDQQQVKLSIKGQHFKQYQSDQFYQKLTKKYKQILEISDEKFNITEKFFNLSLKIINLTKIDDIYLDGRLLKKILIKGISTAKPQSSSLIYYALRFIDENKNILKQDKCFESDWWEDFQKLDLLEGIRKNYLDDYQISKMLKSSIKRMKPAQTAEIQCRDKSLFQFGNDFNQMKQLIKFSQIPQKIRITIRVYNFTQGKTAFNMEIDEKIIQSRRKKVIATKLLQQNNIKKALKRFQNIIAFYSSQKINQQAYDQKVSALMNSVLCYMKLKNYHEMIKLCGQILVKPRHGYQVKDLSIQGPGNAKIQGNMSEKTKQEQGQGQLQEGSSDTRRIAKDLVQNPKIIDKCLYRKAFALFQIGECQEALKSIQLISNQNNKSDQVLKLKQQATKGQQKYKNKSKKIFQSMFSK